MNTRKNKDTNEFEGRVKITGFSSKESLLEKINLYLESYKSEEKESLYVIEKETSKSILLNFKKNTELANYIIRKLKLLQMGNQNFAKLNCHLAIKVISPNQNEKSEKKEKSENENEKSPKKTKKNDYKDIYNIDAKNNPKMNKLLNKSLNFNKRNMNKYLSPENNKMKIYESIFLGGPYLEKSEFEYKDHMKNKAQWINKKGFIPYISKQTILKNAHMIENILSKEPDQPKAFNFRQIEKSKWVGKNDFNHYA
jgi:hypothetical protein